MAKGRKSPFKAKEAAVVRGKRVPVLVNDDELEKIQAAAALRYMPVAEFMRRAALGRRADVAYDVEIVLALSDITRALRAMHADLSERGIPLPEPEMLSLIHAARAAMLRIER